MKSIILQEVIKNGLNIVERISSKSITLPILNNILISTEKNFLNLSVTDLEIGIKWWALTKIEEGGGITVPSRLFSNFINLLPNKKILLEIKNNILFVECENYKTKINGLTADEFPIIPRITNTEFISLKNSLFCQGLSRVVDIPVSSTIKPEISGVYFTFEKDLITIAATDSFRLGEKKITLKNNFPLKEIYSFILPQKTAKEIINIFGGKEGEMKIYFSPNQIMFESSMEETDHPEVQVVSRLIEGEYPNYQEIIPNKYTTTFILDKNEFLNQIKTASLFSGKINEVKIKTELKENKIKLFSQSPDIGEYQSSIAGKIKGEPIDISFNHHFLIDGLSNIKSSEVIFGLSGGSGPGVLKPVGDDSYIYVVMPIKTT